MESILGVLQEHGRVVQKCMKVLGLDRTTTQNVLNRLLTLLVSLQALDIESLKLRSEMLDLIAVRTRIVY